MTVWREDHQEGRFDRVGKVDTRFFVVHHRDLVLSESLQLAFVVDRVVDAVDSGVVQQRWQRELSLFLLFGLAGSSRGVCSTCRIHVGKLDALGEIGLHGRAGQGSFSEVTKFTEDQLVEPEAEQHRPFRNESNLKNENFSHPELKW